MGKILLHSAIVGTIDGYFMGTTNGLIIGLVVFALYATLGLWRIISLINNRF